MSSRGQRGGRPFVLDRGVRRAYLKKKKKNTLYMTYTRIDLRVTMF